MLRLLSDTARRARAEDGSFLVEILVTILLLAVATGGLLTMLEGSARQSATQRERTAATELAQTRLDELRGMPYEQLRELPEPEKSVTRTVGPTTYTLAATVTQRPATESTGQCATDRGRDVLQVSVTGSWPGRARPVRVDTLVAAPVASAGSIRVVVRNRDGQPISGVAATAGGKSATTDAAGCAMIFLPPGDYAVSASVPGTISPAGESVPVQNVTLDAERTVNTGFELDQAGSGLIEFRYRPTGSSADAYDADPKSVLFAHSQMATPRRVDGIEQRTAADPGRTLTVAGLYPFSGPYDVYAGACVEQKPTTPATVSVDRGSTPSTPVVVSLWPLNVRARNGGSAVPADTVMSVRMNCDPALEWNDLPTTAVSSSDRRITRNGFPYAPVAAAGYSVCAYSPTTRGWQRRSDVLTLTGAYPGTSATPVSLDVSQNRNVTPVCAG